MLRKKVKRSEKIKELKDKVKINWRYDGDIISGEVKFEGKTVGWVHAGKPSLAELTNVLDKDSKVIEIHAFYPYRKLYFDEELQKKIGDKLKKRSGLGTLVYNELEKKILEKFPDTEKLILVVEPLHEWKDFNKKATLKFYKSVGFKKYDEVVLRYRAGYLNLPVKDVKYILIKNLKPGPLERLKQKIKSLKSRKSKR